MFATKINCFNSGIHQNMKIIHLDLVQQNGTNIVLIKFPIDQELQSVVRTIRNINWSRTHKSWYIPYSIEALAEINKHIEPVCAVDTTALKNKVHTNESLANKNTLEVSTIQKIDTFISWMRLHRYSESTIKTYTEALKTFLQFFTTKPLSQITNNDIITFNSELISKNNLSASYQSQIVNAIKLFFKNIQKSDVTIEEIHRPLKSKQLPKVISEQEVTMLINVLDNIKHKSMICLLYSAGLRRSELLKMKIEDIDSKRMLIYINKAKGMKDRIVPLSQTALDILHEYYKIYKPKTYLFEGQNGAQYNERGLALVLKKACRLAGINKNVTLHTLRNSYATHLLENGIDLRYIQELLGHTSSKTTEIYTHVSHTAIQKIMSPLDKLTIKTTGNE